jgi:thiol-disulfide isomerase/thioredoxin
MRIISSLLLITTFFACSNDTKKHLPDIEASTLDGTLINNKSFEGKTVVIKVWATWCGTCVAEIPQLNSLVEKYKNDTSIIFLSITDDKRERIEQFLASRPFNYQHITDAKKLKSKFYSGLIEEIPKHIVVSPDGNIIFEHSGGMQNIHQAINEKIEFIKSQN